jgi:hypothetical protein
MASLVILATNNPHAIFSLFFLLSNHQIYTQIDWLLTSLYSTMKFSILLVYFSKYFFKDIFHVEESFRCFPCINYELTTIHLNNFLKMLCIHFLEYLNYFFFAMATQWCSSSSLENVGNLWYVDNKYTDRFTNRQNVPNFFYLFHYIGISISKYNISLTEYHL